MSLNDLGQLSVEFGRETDHPWNYFQWREEWRDCGFLLGCSTMCVDETVRFCFHLPFVWVTDHHTKTVICGCFWFHWLGGTGGPDFECFISMEVVVIRCAIIQLQLGKQTGSPCPTWPFGDWRVERWRARDDMEFAVCYRRGVRPGQRGLR